MCTLVAINSLRTYLPVQVKKVYDGHPPPPSTHTPLPQQHTREAKTPDRLKRSVRVSYTTYSNRVSIIIVVIPGTVYCSEHQYQCTTYYDVVVLPLLPQPGTRVYILE